MLDSELEGGDCRHKESGPGHCDGLARRPRERLGTFRQPTERTGVEQQHRASARVSWPVLRAERRCRVFPEDDPAELGILAKWVAPTRQWTDLGDRLACATQDHD